MASYQILCTTQEVDELIAASHTNPVVIFKHSTTCPISSLAKARVDKALRTEQIDYPVYLLDLLRYRTVSNYIAEELQVRHESPQAIVIRAGKAGHVATHLNIDPEAFSLS